MDIAHVLLYRFWILSSSEACLFLPSRQFSGWLITLNLCKPGFCALLRWISEKPKVFPKPLQLDKTQSPDSVCILLVLGFRFVYSWLYSALLLRRGFSELLDAQVVNKGVMKSLHSGMARPPTATLSNKFCSKLKPRAATL